MTVTAERYATINAVPLDTYGWRVPRGGYDDLLNGRVVRGTDLTMPTASGRRAYPRKVDARTVSIPILINGKLNEAGTPYSDPIQGMLTNRDYLEATLGYPGTSGVDATRGTVPLTFVRKSPLSTLTAQVTFLGLNDWTTRGGGLALARIDLSIPTGVLS